MNKPILFLGLLSLMLPLSMARAQMNSSSPLPIDSVGLSPDYYADKAHILNYQDIYVFFSKDIDSIDGKFYMAPEGVSIASTPVYAHDPGSNFQYQIGGSSYLYYCDEVEISKQNMLFIPYRNYFTAYDHHLKYDSKYQLLFVGEIRFTDGSTIVNTEEDVLADFLTGSIPDQRVKPKGTFKPEDIPHIGFSKKHLEDPTSDRYLKTSWGKTQVHKLTPLNADSITGNNINVAIVDLQIYEHTLVNKAVVFRSHPLEDEMFIEKDKIALLSQDPDSILPLYNHGTQMARYMLNYAPCINIYNYNKQALMDNVYHDSLFAASILDPAKGIDIASFSGSSSAIEKLAEGVHDGLILSRSLGNLSGILNTFEDALHPDIFLPHFNPFLSGEKRASMSGAFVTLQGALIHNEPGTVREELSLNTAYSVRSGAGDAREYTLSVLENGNGATSEATATFSGMVALMLEANDKYGSQYTPREVVEIMFQTAIDIGTPGVDSVFGWGIPDLGAAFAHIKKGAPVTFDLYGVNEYADFTSNSEIRDHPLDIKIYPNPATHRITIDLSADNKNLSCIKLFDLSGKEYSTEEISPNTRIIDLDLKHLPSGVYIVHLSSDKGKLVARRLIKL